MQGRHEGTLDGQGRSTGLETAEASAPRLRRIVSCHGSLLIRNPRDSISNSFLNELDRIATRDYVVTDDDIVRARLRTVGIQEHKLVFKHGECEVLIL